MGMTESFLLTNDSFETIPQTVLPPAPHTTFRCKKEIKTKIVDNFLKRIHCTCATPPNFRSKKTFDEYNTKLLEQ